MSTSFANSKALHKLTTYLHHGLRSLLPRMFWQYQRSVLLRTFDQLPMNRQTDILKRVNYYNRLNRPFSLANTAKSAGEFSFAGKSTAYCIDFGRLIQCLPRNRRVGYLFGDITEVPDTPLCVKSRPIRTDKSNRNSVLLKLNTIRHYHFVPDPRAFADKKPVAVWRGKSNQNHRIDFARRFANHPLCDIGCTQHKEKTPQPYHKAFMSIEEQLTHQFIVSVEGIDVATNLKWIMASNSLCMMRRPRFETWFMEGALIPDVHYVELADDHSDLAEKVEYYSAHPEEAKAIIANAQRHAAQFRDEGTEKITSLLVIQKYLELSQQEPDLLPALQLS